MNSSHSSACQEQATYIYIYTLHHYTQWLKSWPSGWVDRDAFETKLLWLLGPALSSSWLYPSRLPRHALQILAIMGQGLAVTSRCKLAGPGTARPAAHTSSIHTEVPVLRLRFLFLMFNIIELLCQSSSELIKISNM